jgi:hypothetical protein
VEGWRSVGELTQWGFAHATVVMANEAHDGWTRSVRTRESGISIVEAAHAAGVRRLAMEALPWLVAGAPGEPLLVWYGGGHAAKVPTGEWVTMGCHFAAMSGVEAFVIDQTVTIEWKGRPQPGIPEVLAALSDILAAHGGTAGILREQAPPPLDAHTGVDAVVVSTDNVLT